MSIGRWVGWWVFFFLPAGCAILATHAHPLELWSFVGGAWAGIGAGLITVRDTPTPAAGEAE